MPFLARDQTVLVVIASLNFCYNDVPAKIVHGVQPPLLLFNMKSHYLFFTLLTVALTVTAMTQQNPIPNLGPVADGDDTVILSDVLGRDRAINIFAGFTRDFATVTQRFEDRSLNTTILAPVNSAIVALPRKPWEDPDDYEALGQQAYKGDNGEERAKRNVKRFVEAHVVPVSPWKEGEKVKTLAGGEVWWESKDGVRTVWSPSIRVLGLYANDICRYNQGISRLAVSRVSALA